MGSCPKRPQKKGKGIGKPKILFTPKLHKNPLKIPWKERIEVPLLNELAKLRWIFNHWRSEISHDFFWRCFQIAVSAKKYLTVWSHWICHYNLFIMFTSRVYIYIYPHLNISWIYVYIIIRICLAFLVGIRLSHCFGHLEFSSACFRISNSCLAHLKHFQHVLAVLNLPTQIICSVHKDHVPRA